MDLALLTLLAITPSEAAPSWDFNATAISFIIVNILVGLWSVFRTMAQAKSAYELADKANKRADEAHAAIILTNANISILREKIAGEYPDHGAIEAMEKRLIAEIHRVSDRLDQILDRRPPRT